MGDNNDDVSSDDDSGGIGDYDWGEGVSHLQHVEILQSNRAIH